MNKKELLSTYRARVLELEELRTQLRRGRQKLKKDLLERGMVP